MTTAQRNFWTLAICGAIILTLSTGIRQTFGLFLKPITIDLNVGRELFGFSNAMQNLLWGLVAPFAGAFADKWGTGRIVAAGGACYVAGLLGMAYAFDSTTLVLGNLLIGIALASTGFSVILGTIGRATPEAKRSMVFGVVTAAGSLGQFAMVPYGQILIDGFGWSVALIVLAATSSFTSAPTRTSLLRTSSGSLNARVVAATPCRRRS